MSDDLPPPYPHDDEIEATSFVEIGAPPPGDLPDEPPRASTNTRFTVPALRDDLAEDPRLAERRQAAAALRRAPAPKERRPTLTGGEGELHRPRTVRPGVLEPVRPRPVSGHRDLVEPGAENSDVISSFSAGLAPAPMAEPPPVPGPPSRPRLERRPPRPAGMPPAAPRQPVVAATTHLAAPPMPLPLDAELVASLITDQRRRLHVLFAWARALEVSAGVLGTISLAVMVTAVVGALLAAGPALLPGAGAFVAAAVGVGLAVLQVVAAVALRQVAHLSAQQAALIEALCQTPRRPR